MARAPERIPGGVLGVGVAAIAGALILLVLVWLTIPATVALIDRALALSHGSVVRVYLIWPLVATLLLLGWLLVRTRRDQPRRAVLLGVLTAANAIVIGVLLADRKDFTAEISSMTWFTSVVLLSASAAAFVNLWMARRDGRPVGWVVFWGILGLGFAAAALDEALALHESIGTVIDRLLGRPEADDASPTGVAQDFITVLYASAAVVVGVVLVFVSRRGWIPRGSAFHLVGVAGIVTYAMAVSLDNLDKGLAAIATSVDLVYLANSIEEVLEFTAASLFLAAAVIAVVERRGAAARTAAGQGRTIGGRGAVAALAVATVTTVAVATALPVLVPVPKSIINEPERYDITEIKTADGASINPDGMRYVDGALYITDDIDATLLVVEDGQMRRLAGPEHGLVRPESVAVAPDGAVYVSDDISNQLYVVREGEAPRLVAGPEDGLLGPRGLAVDEDGTLFIGDRLGVSVVQYDGTRLEQVAGALEGISEPEELTVDDSGRVYVAEEGVGQVRRIDGSGRADVVVDKTSGIESPEGIIWMDDHLYVADAKVGAVFRFDESGQGGPLVTFAPRYERVEGLAVGEDGTLYVGLRRDQPLSGMVLALRPKAAGG